MIIFSWLLPRRDRRSLMDRLCDWAERPSSGWILGGLTILLGSLAAICLTGSLP